MHSRWVLEIPEFAFLLQQETILEWQLYGPDKKGGYRKVRWEVRASAAASRITAAGSRRGAFSAEVDFEAREIVFCQGEMSDGEFTEFLRYLMERTSLQVQPGLMHFISKRKKEPENAFEKDDKTPTF
ncbi:hypothetical protein ACTL32_00705 [Planococcus sp. FY231025]|uniref:hypothetical protein n=1 Tax=Planococcus sp. FY231025 TaxID=3455699 RepID=UPI003F911266